MITVDEIQGLLLACTAINETWYCSAAPWTRQSPAFAASAPPVTSRHRRKCVAGVSRPISIWPKLGTRPLVEEEADRWAIARRSRLPARFTRTLARGPILVAVAPGPDMAVEDAWETSEADGETRSCGGEPGGEGVGTEVPGEAWSAELALVAARRTGWGNLQHLEAVEEEVEERTAGSPAQLRGA